MGEPDQIIYMRDQPYAVPCRGCRRVPVLYGRSWLDYGQVDSGHRAKPGNRAVVHHAKVDIRPASASDVFPREACGHYAPGFTSDAYPRHRRLRSGGAKLVFQMHYTPNGSPQEDRSMIGIRFADPTTVKKMVRGRPVSEVSFKIPAGDPHYEVKTKHLFMKDTLLFSLFPHMHARGKDFKLRSTTRMKTAKSC